MQGQGSVFFLQRYQSLDAKLYKVLLEIKGLNLIRVELICKIFGLRLDVSLREISKEIILNINDFVYKRFLVDKRFNRLNRELVDKLVKSGSYRGISRKRALPVRGQRTKVNARTARKLNGISNINR